MLRRRGNELQMSLFMMLLSAFQLLLGRYASASEVVVGAPIAGRARSETHQMVGYFVNVLALRTDLTGVATVDELLHLDVILGVAGFDGRHRSAAAAATAAATALEVGGRAAGPAPGRAGRGGVRGPGHIPRFLLCRGQPARAAA